jgi:hypothetical protein
VPVSWVCAEMRAGRRSHLELAVTSGTVHSCGRLAGTAAGSPLRKRPTSWHASTGPRRRSPRSETRSPCSRRRRPRWRTRDMPSCKSEAARGTPRSQCGRDGVTRSHVCHVGSRERFKDISTLPRSCRSAAPRRLSDRDSARPAPRFRERAHFAKPRRRRLGGAAEAIREVAVAGATELESYCAALDSGLEFRSRDRRRRARALPEPATGGE